MAKKGEINEKPDDQQLNETPPAETPPKEAKKEAVNIMSTDDAHEPPKEAKKAKKEAAESQVVDLSPILEKIDEGFKSLAPQQTPAAKKEKKEFDQDFLSPLGDW